MGITSFYFLCFFAAILIVYYLIPGRLQWLLLLACSVAYYLMTGNGLLILYPTVSVTACFLGIRLLAVIPAEEQRRRRWILTATILVNIGILVVLKYVNFGIYTIDGIAQLFGSSKTLIKSVDFLIPLGVSFYTFSLLGYVIDVYYGIAKPQRNYWKLMLYGMYFPVIISGPILKYREHGEQFFVPHRFDYRMVTRGMQRMLWGFFKKLVIAERLGTLVDTVYGGYTEYPGAYIWFATVCYAFQLYTDFSGCMDIVLGMSESLGIVLPENFQTPFFAKSVAEYWRRWHITLGVWMKEYVFFPVLRSPLFTDLNKSWKEKFGKKKGKQYVTFAAMFLLWLTVGIWHGGESAAHIEDVSAGMYRGSVLPCGVGGRRIRHAGQGGFRVESVGALERSAVRAGTGLDRSDDRGAFAAFASGSVVAAAERVCAGQDRRVCAAGQMGALVRFAVCGDTVRVLRAGIQRRGVYLPGILMAAFVGVLYGKERKYMVECVKISR